MAQRLHRPPQEKVDVSHGNSLARLLLARNGQPVAGEISTENHVMALVINTNIASIQSERALATNRGSMEQAMQRLSSGKRINSAIDDAAGIAVTQRMRNQIQGLNMAIRNAGDGISMAQTAEGAIDEIQNMLHRMRELAVQSSNGTYTSEDRSFLSVEFNELVKEIRRVSNQAAWDGDLKLISEDAKAMNVQVGISAADYIKIPLGPLTIEDLNLAERTTVNNTSGAQINTWDLKEATSGVTTSGVSGTRVLDENQQVIDVNFTDVPLPNFELKLWNGTRQADGTPNPQGVSTLTAAGVTSVSDLVKQLKGHVDYDPTTVDIQNVGGQLKVVWKILGSPMPAGTPSLAATNTGTGSADSKTQSFTAASAAAASVVDLSGTQTDYRPQSFDLSGFTWFKDSVPTSKPNFFELRVGERMLTAHNVTSIEDLRKQLKEDSDYEFIRREAGLPEGYEMFDVASGTTLTVKYGQNAQNLGFLRYSESNVNIANTQDAITALDFIDKAQVTVNTMRAEMGATMSRIEYTINNLMNIVENTEEAKSRILDTDYAKESANLAKAQVLAQAGTAMLAQANQSQQYVLNLLRQG
jgi:flagellin